MAYRYDTGTISVANGDTTVTGTLTGWASTVRRGDNLHAGGNPSVEIDGDPDNDSVTDNTHFELVEPWPYATLTDAPYSISQGPAWNDVTRLSVEVATALASSTEILSGTGVPSDSIGSDGSAYFRQDAPELYFKASGAWGSAIDLTGPTGPQGANNITSSTTSRTLGTGSMSFEIDAGKAIQSGMRMRVSNSGSNYMEGVVTSYSGPTLTISMDRFVGSGTYAVWAIAPVGDKGDTGATGASYAGTSTTSLTVGTGSQAFTTQAGLAYVVGSPIRLASAANPANFMEGVVAAYSGTSMTATIAVVGGSGTLTDWSLSLTGRQGATGPTGNSGPANSLSIGTVTTGAAGSSAAATITGTAPSQTLNLTIPKGDAGADGADGQSLNPRGNYNSGTAYAEYDVVLDQGSSWVLIVASSTGNDPPTLPTTSNTQWQLLAEKGVDGTGLVNSVNGIGPTSGDVTLAASDVPNVDTPSNYTPTADDVQGHLRGIDSKLGASAVVGEIKYFPFKTAPNGFYIADGSAKSRSTDSNLFSVLVPVLGTFTVTIASPGVFSLNSHGLIAGDPVYLTTTGALPTGLSQNTIYYVKSPTTNTFQLSATLGGSSINTTGTQSGTHTIRYCPFGLGDGSTTFNLPDLRGYFPRGYDNGAGVDSGRTLGSYQSDAFQGHRHDRPSGTIAFLSQVGSGGTVTWASGNTIVGSNSTGDPVTDGSNGTPRVAVETRPKNIALLACIAH